MNILNAIPLSATLIICSLMSYWHGNNKNGMRKFGLIYTIILGTHDSGIGLHLNEYSRAGSDAKNQ